jgi:hypothetical protein
MLRRFSIRWLMVAVAVIAVGLGVFELTRRPKVPLPEPWMFPEPWILPLQDSSGHWFLCINGDDLRAGIHPPRRRWIHYEPPGFRVEGEPGVRKISRPPYQIPFRKESP